MGPGRTGMESVGHWFLIVALLGYRFSGLLFGRSHRLVRAVHAEQHGVVDAPPTGACSIPRRFLINCE